MLATVNAHRDRHPQEREGKCGKKRVDGSLVELSQRSPTGYGVRDGKEGQVRHEQCLTPA